MLSWLKRLAALAALSIVAACGGGDDDDHPRNNIVQVAQANSEFSILVEALNAAELTSALSGPGPFTVFAPTNAAFAALLEELGQTKEELLGNKPLLTAVLKYHVVQGAVPKAAVPLGKAIEALEGGIFKVDAVDGKLVITDGRNRKSNIVLTDIAASNGVIHVIDKVILPADKNIVETAQANPDFSILVEALTAVTESGQADLVALLSGEGPFTVFAPTNAAFAALVDELGTTKEALLADTVLLEQVLKYHVLSGRVLKADVPVNTSIPTAQGGTLIISPALVITDERGRTANITATDVLTSNGVIHVIDKVILPASSVEPVQAE